MWRELREGGAGRKEGENEKKNKKKMESQLLQRRRGGGVEGGKENRGKKRSYIMHRYKFSMVNVITIYS